MKTQKQLRNKGKRILVEIEKLSTDDILLGEMGAYEDPILDSIEHTMDFSLLERIKFLTKKLYDLIAKESTTRVKTHATKGK